MQSYYEACKETEGDTFGLFYEVAIFACHLILLSTFNKKLTIGKPQLGVTQIHNAGTAHKVSLTAMDHILSSYSQSAFG